MSLSCVSCFEKIVPSDLYRCPETGRGADKGRPHHELHRACMADWAQERDLKKRAITCCHPGCDTDISFLLPTRKRVTYFLERHPVVATLATMLPLGAISYSMKGWGEVAATVACVFASCIPLLSGTQSGKYIGSAMFSGTFIAISIATGYAIAEELLPGNDWSSLLLPASVAGLNFISYGLAQNAGQSPKASKLDKILTLAMPFIGLAANFKALLTPPSE